MKWDVDILIGPVQAFVAQARRTRDLWGGSYLVSYLAAQAMRGGERAGGNVIRPYVEEDAMLGWLAGRADSPPALGGTPNHFVLRTDGEPEVAAAAVEAAFWAAWRRVCDAVWRKYVERAAAKGNGTAAIWRRQVEACWEFAWVAAPADQSKGELARRKHWRTLRLPDEPGDKCTVMADFQELSGHPKSRPEQTTFWNAIRERVGALELREDEKLCAPATVKRLFARCADEAIGAALDADHWPSTVDIAAVPWLRQVSERARTQAESYVHALRDAAPHAVRRQVPMSALADAEPRDFMKLDANYYHPAFLSTPDICPLTKPAERERLRELLTSVTKAAGGAAPVYYALLLADGDKLGDVVAQLRSEPVGRALAEFGRGVRRSVEKAQGVTLYAGGDDVLAMLPARHALACADRLAEAYERELPAMPDKRATLSAAVVFAHMRMPVGGVLAEAHRLLDEVAKDGNGRDSLVAAVLKPGGPYCQWVTKWHRDYGDGRGGRGVAQVQELAEAMAADERELSTSLLYHLRHTFESLGNERHWLPGATIALPERLELTALVRTELTDSWTGRIDDDSERLTHMTRLVTDLLLAGAGRVGLDALLLARFLSDGGQEGDHG